ncbi:RNA polymerase sigma factor [bacterium]|nr:RNA polymerase sigma factor [bacterium]
MRSDMDLLQAIQQQDTDAFEVFFERHRERVRLHISKILRNPDATEDVLQETFLRVWQHADQWDHSGACISWLLKIATNLALNSLRSWRRKREVPLEGHSSTGEQENSSVPEWMVDEATIGPEEALEISERLAMARRLVDDLPEEKREVIRLVHESDMGIGEAAQTLGIPEGTIKSRLHNARKHLARQWDKICSEWEEL